MVLDALKDEVNKHCDSKFILNGLFYFIVKFINGSIYAISF